MDYMQCRICGVQFRIDQLYKVKVLSNHTWHLECRKSADGVKDQSLVSKFTKGGDSNEDS